MYDYSLKGLGTMINEKNQHRVDAYVRALQSTIRPDSVVLELGAGMGFFSLLAARMGARHVYAVEPNPLIQVGREAAQTNGLAQRITFIQELSSNIDLPEPADIMVSDMRGVLPWLADHIPSIVDARTRLLKPNGVLIPQRDSVWAAVVHAPKHYANRVDVWEKNTEGLNLDAARRRAVNRWGKGHVQPENLLTVPTCWATLDYGTESDPDAKGTIQWVIEESEMEEKNIEGINIGHGLSLWFDSELCPGVGFSNSPHAPHIPVYSQLFFPWEQPVALAVGDTVDVTLQAKRVENSYEWLWHTRIQDVDSSVKADYRQSTFYAKIIRSDMQLSQSSEKR